jgi:hypothetical protein
MSSKTSTDYTNPFLEANDKLFEDNHVTPDDKKFLDSFKKEKDLDIHSPEFLRQT